MKRKKTQEAPPVPLPPLLLPEHLELLLVVLLSDAESKRNELRAVAWMIRDRMDQIVAKLEHEFNPDKPEFFSDAGELQALGPRLDAAAAGFSGVSRVLRDLRHILWESGKRNGS